MLEAIFKLLKLEMQITVAVLTLVSGAVLWLLRLLVRRMGSAPEIKPQPKPERQDTGVPVVSAPASPAAIQSPANQVVVIREPSPQAAAQPTGTPVQQVLGNPDHALYIARNSEWIVVHPKSDELLEMVDRMGFAALFRDGDPFIEAAPDMSGPVETAEPLPPEADPDFLDGEKPTPVPVSDGQLWVRSVGTYRQAIPVGTEMNFSREATF